MQMETSHLQDELSLKNIVIAIVRKSLWDDSEEFILKNLTICFLDQMLLTP
jgi:hypothetical protein